MHVPFRPLSLSFLALALSGCPEIDGSGNNPFDPDLGTPGSALVRVAPNDYGDDVSSLAGAGRPSPRVISNIVHDQDSDIPNAAGASAWIWQWGQFVDHDIDLTPGNSGDAANIPVPPGDIFGTPFIPFTRSGYVPGTGTDPSNPREHPNQITAWIDGSNVYGSDDARAQTLRRHNGKLKLSPGRLLPFNTFGLDNDNGPPGAGDPEDFFVAGDIRVNEQVGLTSTHTLFAREHNRLAKKIRKSKPHLPGHVVYEMARSLVASVIQSITFEEYLPLLLGSGAIPPYSGYDPSIDAQIATEFSTALYRVGHTQLNGTLLRLDENLDTIPEGNLLLRDGFFNPTRITDEGGIEPLLRGLALQVANSVDPFVIDDVRDFLFGPPGSGGTDLASLNIQRGRDHGIPSYNALRAAYFLAPAADYDEISSDPAIQQRLEDAYGPGNVDDVDAWTGAISEDLYPGAMVGELIRTALIDQFTALRDGDRFWYELRFPPHLVAQIKASTLSKVIRRNTQIGSELQKDVFITP